MAGRHRKPSTSWARPRKAAASAVVGGALAVATPSSQPAPPPPTVQPSLDLPTDSIPIISADAAVDPPTVHLVAARTISVQQRVYTAALAYLGPGGTPGRIPYRYGGKHCAPGASCDCSAWVWTVLHDAGLTVPYRTSGQLRAWATPEPRAAARPGDLVFWAGHVGIVGASNTVIHQGGPQPGPKHAPIWTAPGGPVFGRIP